MLRQIIRTRRLRFLLRCCSAVNNCCSDYQVKCVHRLSAGLAKDFRRILQTPVSAFSAFARFWLRSPLAGFLLPLAENIALHAARLFYAARIAAILRRYRSWLSYSAVVSLGCRLSWGSYFVNMVGCDVAEICEITVAIRKTHAGNERHGAKTAKRATYTV